MTSNMVKKAREFARRAHDSVNHRRKYTDEPYHVHPARVAKILEEITDDEAIIAAAWLHDVLEDVAPKNPEYNEDAIREYFGEDVLQLVLEVTDVSRPEDGNRSERKAIDRKHTAKASDRGKLIKIADMTDNIIDIAKHDKHFARVFAREAILSMTILDMRHEFQNNLRIKALFENLKVLLMQHR